MKISHNWLKDFIVLDRPVEEISELLTQTGLEVEGVETFEQVTGNLEGVVIGEVISCRKHPDAERLSIAQVDIGQPDNLQIVCGAPNVAAGQKVVVATVGTTLYPANGDPFKIKKAKIRGEISTGMICAEDEIGLGKDHGGIIVLDTDLKNGSPATEYFQLENEVVYEIGLTPNRADAASHYGVSRDLKAVMEKEVTFEVPEIEDNRNFPLEVKVLNETACPRYSGVVLDNLEVKESPDWLKTRLTSIGLSPINNVVDITNYICHSLGQPLHAFDYEKISGEQVIVKTAEAGEKFVTLDEKERTLSNRDLMICNAETGMCIAGVFGGIESGVTEATTRIFLESAYFSADYVRRTAMHHGLKTDASFRFERGTDPNMTVKALKKAVVLLQELAGASVASGIYDLYPEPVTDLAVAVKYRNITRLIGKELGKDTIKNILLLLDIQVESETEQGFTAIVPPYRVDVTREADIVEEILRIYGFNNIEVDENNGANYLSDFEEKEPNKIRRYISNILVGSGYNEILTNSLTNPAYVTEQDGFSAEESVNILNKLSEELGIMRQSMIFGGLESMAYNINRRYTNLRFYEFGKVYTLRDGKYREEVKLALFLTGNVNEEHWRAEKEPVDFHVFAGAVYKVLHKFSLPEISSEPTSSPSYRYGLDLKLNGRVIATLGSLSEKVLKSTGIRQEVFYAELDWEYIIRKHTTEIVYQPIPKFPEVRRDLSLVLDSETTYRQVRETAFRADKKLLKKMNVFSVYEGDKIEEGKKSYAISFILQDTEKTLTDKIIDKTMNNLMRAFEQKINAVIRK